MAAINDLISQIQDETLRNRIQEEVSKMAKQKKFGLVFEEHMPESTPLYDMPIKREERSGLFFKIIILSRILMYMRMSFFRWNWTGERLMWNMWMGYWNF